MGKFKVGDRVRCIDSEGTTCVAFGAEYEVESFGGSFVYLKGCAGGMYASRFTHVTPTITIEPGKHYRLRNGKVTGRISQGDIGFEALVDGQVKVFDKAGGAVFSGDDIVEAWVPKVGERVYVVYGHGWNGEGEVKDIAYQTFVIILKSGSRAGSSGGFTLQDIEPLLVAAPAQPLRIQQGKFYKTRDGRKVGPMSKRSTYLTAEGWHYNESGECCYQGMSGETPRPTRDLIAEWVDEPVAIANDNVAPAIPKFKAGDRVVCLDSYAGQFTAGKTYVVRADHHGREYESVRVERDDSGSTENGWLPKFFKLADTQPTAIVALIEDGQPKPAERPHVHASVESATVEAERLAGLYRGQRFGVYVLHDTRETDQPDYGHEWKNLAARGQKIAAIKELRSLTGLNLSAAKTAVEKWTEYELAA